ncbi:MAG: peroxiredoxin [Alphaproteobacteria bacterium]|nr:peroxiredoxin [Alphaproteobacteria bacterium]
MTIKVGDTVPSGSFNVMTDKGPAPLTSDELFKGKKVMLFALPGAFTPTCSAKHVPGFLANHDAIKAKGVGTIACLSVNDAFVMGAWGKDQKSDGKIVMLADGSGEYTKKLGLELDLTARGMGVRSRRYAMLVDNGVVKQLQIEPNPGGLDVSAAEKMLALI